MSESLRQRTRQTLDRVRRELLDERSEEGHWVGELSPSSLSTATAISAMSALVIHGGSRTMAGNQDSLRDCIARGVGYLREGQNDDGGFGDTDRSHSNIATSFLALAASALAGRAIGESLPPDSIDGLNDWIESAGSIEALRKRYGKDKTFVVPILTNLAIAELVSWDEVSALPFEAAVFPQSMYRLLQMPVVSYAIPALVAIGQARHFHGRKAPAPLRWIRAASIGRTMKVLRRMQPDSGGYLEATPLTSFVVMSLAVTGRGDHEVGQSGLRFLIDSMNENGSWPIDTNLATWVTSLSMHALASDPADDGSWCSDKLVKWHLSCQHTSRHPFTGAEPGGWGWSDLSGAVPDSDDTPAAILALRQARRWVHGPLDPQCEAAIGLGIQWLRKLQNRDGGWPTFCRGWGKLPFDRSSNDLTAHALRAMLGGSDSTSLPISSPCITKACAFLRANQQQDGSWLPLWFGNQDRPDESNPVYGTSRVLVADSLGILSSTARQRGCEFLVTSQNTDGGWGGGASISAWLRKSRGEADSAWVSSVEETALAVDALATVLLSQRNRESGPSRASGPSWATQPDRPSQPSPTRSSAESRNLTPTVGVQSGYIGAENPEDGSMLLGTTVAAGNEAYREAIIRGVEFLLGSVDDGRHRVPWPIGFYFAKLWYHERLYSLIFTATALGKYLRATADDYDPNWPL